MSRKKEKEIKIVEVAKYEITTDTKIITGKETQFHLLLNKKDSGYTFDSKNMCLIDNNDFKHIVKTWRNGNEGYEYFNIAINKLPYKIPVHRIVAALFIPIPPDLVKLGYKQINLVPNHLDGVKYNNEVYNLEWTTIQRNTQHAFDNGMVDSSVGEKSHLAKITKEQAIKICEMLQDGKTYKEIIDEIGCSKKIVIHIKCGECWKALSKNYNFPKSDVKPYIIDDKIIHKVCKAIEKNKYTDTEIAKKYGLTRRYVNSIRNHRNRNDISCKYKF